MFKKRLWLAVCLGVWIVGFMVPRGRLYAQEKDMKNDLGLGFFSAYEPQEEVVRIFASYAEWEFKVEDIPEEKLLSIFPGSLVEFTFYPTETCYILTDIVDYAIPAPEEYEKIVEEYRRKRREMLDGKEGP